MFLITWPYYIIPLFPEWQTATINITVHTVLIQTSGRVPVLAPEGTLMISSVRRGGAAGILTSISVRTLLQTQGTKNWYPTTWGRQQSGRILSRVKSFWKSPKQRLKVKSSLEKWKAKKLRAILTAHVDTKAEKPTGWGFVAQTRPDRSHPKASWGEGNAQVRHPMKQFSV